MAYPGAFLFIECEMWPAVWLFIFYFYGYRKNSLRIVLLTLNQRYKSANSKNTILFSAKNALTSRPGLGMYSAVLILWVHNRSIDDKSLLWPWRSPVSSIALKENSCFNCVLEVMFAKLFLHAMHSPHSSRVFVERVMWAMSGHCSIFWAFAAICSCIFVVPTTPKDRESRIKKIYSRTNHWLVCVLPSSTISTTNALLYMCRTIHMGAV